jgi:hypothetical protein
MSGFGGFGFGQNNNQPQQQNTGFGGFGANTNTNTGTCDSLLSFECTPPHGTLVLGTLEISANPSLTRIFVCSVQEQDLVLPQIPVALAARIHRVEDSLAVVLLALEALEVCRLRFSALEPSARHDVAYAVSNLDLQSLPAFFSCMSFWWIFE